MASTSHHKPGRNAPCPCGSGKKYKRCCEGKQETDAGWPAPQRRSRRLRLMLSAVLVAILAVWVVTSVLVNNPQPTAPAGNLPADQTPDPWAYDRINDRHWHPGHGHWHDGPPPPGVAPQNDVAPRDGDASQNAGNTPTDDTPEPWEYDPVNNRHWHPNHGHWHQGPPPQDR